MTDKQTDSAESQPARDGTARRAFLRNASGVAGTAAVTLILAAGTKRAHAIPNSQID